MKKCMICVMLVLALITASVPAAFAQTVEFEVRFDDGAVLVEGTAGAGPEWIVLEVLKEGYLEQGALPDFPNKTNTCYFGQTKTEADGSFVFPFGLRPEDGTGTYRFRIMSQAMEVAAEQKIDYVTEADLQTAYQDIRNSSGQAELAALMESSALHRMAMKDQGLYIEDLDVNDTALCQALAQKLIHAEFTDWASLKAVFNEELAYPRLNAADAKALTAVLEKNADIFGIDVGENSAYADFGTYRLNVNGIIASNKPFENSAAESAKQKLGRVFEEALAITAVNTANSGNIVSVINTYNACLKLDLNGGYSRLSTAQQAQVRAALLGKNFSTVAAISQAFDSTVLALVNNLSSGSGTGGGGGGNSGGGTASSSIPTPAPTAVPQPTQEPADSFVDLDSAAWARDSIERLAGLGIVSGFGERQFKPNEQVTREQFVKMIMDAFAVEVNAESSTAFTDVEGSAWYAPYVNTAYEKGLVSGMGENRFGVGVPIFRQDLATIAYRFMIYLGKTMPETEEPIPFIDAGRIDLYAAASVRALQMADVINGLEDGRFAPHEFASRAAAAKIIDALMHAVQE